MTTKTATKYCSMCKTSKPLTSFHRNPQNKDGRSYECATCRSLARTSTKRLLAWNDNNPELAIEIGGLKFLEHAESIHRRFTDFEKGIIGQAPLFAYYGGAKLAEPEIMQRVRIMQNRGMIK